MTRALLTIRETADSEGEVYFVRAARFVKIGWTNNFRARLAQLQVANPYKLTVMHRVPGPELHEHLLHQLFRKHHKRGEWFKYNPLFETVITLLKDHGSVPAVIEFMQRGRISDDIEPHVALE